MINFQSRLLVAEDDAAYARQLSEALMSEGYTVVIAHDGGEALRALENRQIDMGFIDLAMPGIDGMRVLENAQRLAPEVPLVMITGYATIEKAVKATRLGAYDFIEKPVSLDRILLTAERALEKRRLQQRSHWMADDILSRYKMVGTSKPMQHLYALIDKIAPTDSNVLITGETGTGKELVAMALHLRSNRSDGPYVKVNCAAIPETLIESELFGHKRGAFTGATADKTGKFKQAHGGSIFLDEIADLSLSAQAKILRVLQEQEIEPLGDTRTICVDTRIISATNKNLPDLIGREKFREDLFYRLQTMEIAIPPLRERREDIPELAKYFLDYFCHQNNRYIEGFEPQAIQLLLQQEWRGNIRQLRSTIERLAVFARGEKIILDEVKFALSPQSFHSISPFLSFRQANHNFQREFLKQALIAHDWNISAAAASLEIDRTNLYKKMQQLGIDKPDSP
ncbi:sigma-54-dependent Fis family transcriptional regulator [candidate division KSB1 bacterium]|nr:sigma-54-dependent Fis family transcriptional regulator [candidate division KSB1 bacterium]